MKPENQPQESISAFEIIKIGIGPSSSHTMGPWRAALIFLKDLDQQYGFDQVKGISVELFGSLAKTGKGHGTDVAVIMGLRGIHYRDIQADLMDDTLDDIYQKHRIVVHFENDRTYDLPFNPHRNITFHYDEFLAFHSNGMRFHAVLQNDDLISKDFFSIGGGFVVRDETKHIAINPVKTPYPCHNASTLLERCLDMNLSISELTLLNEKTWRSEEKIREQALRIWQEIQACIYRSIQKTGTLPGGLQVKRRAGELYQKLLGHKRPDTQEKWMRELCETNPNFVHVNKWISCFALAVNEENAAFGRVITAPTNGASGVLPAVLMYAYCFAGFRSDDDIINFILTAGEIGTLFKKGATISAAMGGCQAEVGVSSAMSAAALTELLGGNPGQVLMAAEIAMEHHLGLTCDPIAGLVQVPCIERNSMGAMKAITAAYIAIESDYTTAKVSLDDVIKTMLETALDMHHKYKETAEGGLAISVNIPEC